MNADAKRTVENGEKKMDGVHGIIIKFAMKNAGKTLQ